MEHSYIITYDLCAPGRNYDALYAAIKSYGTWGKLTESAWVVVSSHSSVDIRDYLLKFIDGNDRLGVFRLGQEAAWFKMMADNAWLQTNLVK